MISKDARFELDRSSERNLRLGLGKLLDRSPNVVRVRYDFSVQGGAVGSVNLLEDLDDSGSLVKLPDNAIIKQVTVDILTAMASSGGTGTIALSSEGSGDLLAAVDADTLSGLVAGIPDGAAANMIKLTAERTLVAEIATEALTAGKFDAFVEYYLGN